MRRAWTDATSCTDEPWVRFFEESRAWVIRNKKDSKSPLTMLESIAASAFAGPSPRLLAAEGTDILQ